MPKNFKVYFLLGNDASVNIIPLAKKKGWHPVDISKGGKWPQQQIKEEYLDLIASFNQWNAEIPYWWATHFSSKNRINSPVLPYLKELHQILSAIEDLKRDESLVLLDISWPVIETLKVLVSKNGYKLKICFPLFFKLRSLTKAKYLFWKNFFAEVVFSLLSIWKAKRAFGKPHIINSKTPVYLIKSFTYLRNFNDKLYKDPFFGRLPEYLKENSPDTNILTVALGFQDRVECYQKMKELNNNLVHPIEIYLTYWDVIKKLFHCFWRMNFYPFQIKENIYWLGYEITPFFRELMSFGGFNISIFHALHFDIAKQLGEKYQIKACLMTYEGRPWERFFIAGLRKSNKNTFIVGCQHTVIPLSAADMFLHPDEKALIPLPDKIVTTGMIPKNILEKHGSYPKEQIEAGCALRFEYLQNLSLFKCRKESKHNFVLLVAFGGSEEEIPLLNYALGQASLNRSVIFRMRTHPTFSWDRLLSLSSWKKLLPENVGNSTYSEVLDDLKDCDAILYWGTTVAMEALMSGKPIIQFDRGDLLNYDPLFEFTDFKWQVQRKDPLQKIIEKIQALPETLYCEHQQQGRKYMEQYFFPVTDGNMSKFLYN